MRVHRWSALVIACLLLATTPAAASAGQPSENRPFVVSGHVRQVSFRDALKDQTLTWFKDTQTVLDIVEPAYYLAQVSLVDGNAAFEFGLEATGDQVVAASQVAYDNETGEALLAVGVPTSASLLEADAAGADLPAWVTESGEAGASTAVIAAATWEPGRGAFGTFWTDPVGITVSSVITEIRWEYNGTNVRNPVVDDLTAWFSPNGWSQVSHTRGAYLNAARTVATGYSQVHHKTSSWFPSPTCGTTRVKYYSNSAYGGRTGNISGGVTSWTEGSCGGLLSIHTVVRRGVP